MDVTEGILRVPTVIPTPGELLALAAVEPDPHLAFHIRSMLGPIGDPLARVLCVRCAEMAEDES